MTNFYFNSGVKPHNTNVEYQIAKGNKFINGELHIPFTIEDDIKDDSILYCLSDSAIELYGNNKGFIVSKVIDGNMLSNYAVFHKS